jgi:hypothetical protein
MRSGRRRIRQRSAVVSLTCVAVVSAAGLTGLTGTTGTARAGNTDPAPSNNSYVQTWTTAPPGHDQQAQEEANFVAYYTDPIYLAETNGDQRNDDLADTLMDIDYDFTRLPTDQLDLLDAAVNAIRTEAAQFPYMLNANGPGINSPDPALAEPLRQDAQWLQSLPSTSAGLIHPDPITQQTEQHLIQSAPEIYRQTRYDRYLSQGLNRADARAKADSDTISRNRAGRKSVLKSSEVDSLRRYYNHGINFNNQPVGLRPSFVQLVDQFNAQYGLQVSYSAIWRAVEGVGAYAPGRWDAAGIPFRDPSAPAVPATGQTTTAPLPARCAPDNTCPALYMTRE